MKKLLVLFATITLPQLSYSHDTLEQGIRESNTLIVKNYLNDRIAKSNPLTYLELEQYLDLAQHQIVVRYNQVEWNKIKPEKISFYTKAASLCALLNMLTVLGFLKTPFTIQNQSTIIKLFWGTFIGTILLAIPAAIEMKAYEREIKELYENSIQIKQLIYKAAYSSQ
jgi:TM2 domain-containing membrane protein YozV